MVLLPHPSTTLGQPHGFPHSSAHGGAGEGGGYRAHDLRPPPGQGSTIQPSSSGPPIADWVENPGLFRDGVRDSRHVPGVRALLAARPFPTLPAQIDRWEGEYLADWPELLEKLKRSYSEAGVNWKRIARSRIFPHLIERLSRMRTLHRSLLRSLPSSWRASRRVLKLDFPVRFVIYVGIGVGAGWATGYGGKPACLFGLENAAEASAGKIGGTVGLVSHEVAHLAHGVWRRQSGLRAIELPRRPLWQLYEEGFATEAERQISGSRRFRQRTGRSDWLARYTSHRA